tara:strand:- start:51 stop:512 length:462 start_codon:yes stop_codon:yes gene_type:complete
MTKSWGPCTWFLFHTLAEKIKEERFMELKPGLIDIIKNICSNLPCPDCKQHATAKIKTLNDKAINNKDSLKKALLLFHNEVNKRLNKPQFIWEELNNKYSKGKILDIVVYFRQQWNIKSSNPKLMNEALHRKLMLDDLHSWCLKYLNPTYFNV